VKTFAPAIPKRLYVALRLVLALTACVGFMIFVNIFGAAPAKSAESADELQIEVHKKGLGKEVVMRRGKKEWYMLIEVSEGTSVVIRQEKDGETYLVDESETHDESLSKAQVDAAIEAFITGVKNQMKRTQ
jgi:hypothetical protein